MKFFKDVALAPPDIVLNVSTAFRNDERKHKVDLGVGVYKNEALSLWVLPTVKIAEERLLHAEVDKGYLPIEGEREYNQEIGKLLGLPNEAFIAQSVGGTSALRIAADFLFRHGPKVVYITEPTWPNHRQVFATAGLEVRVYKHIDEVQEGSAVILQACCHNPTGIDPTPNEWKELVDVIKKKRVLPFFDCAYQGFAHGIKEDAFAITEFAKHFDEMIVAYSCSKNFGLYGERVGAVCFMAPNIKEVASQVRVLIRANYSNPPVHGARIVKTILKDEALRTMWEEEVALMRKRLKEMRHALVHKFKEKNAPRDFSFLLQQNGMFSFTGLSKDQVELLTQKYAIYMTPNGRISIAGLSHSNLDYVVDSIVSIL